MPDRIRGSEVNLRISIDGRQVFFKTSDFTLTERGEIVEEGFIGEDVDDLDYRHDGYDIAFSVQNRDRTVIDFLQDITARQANRQAHPNITITVYYAWRNTSDPATIQVLQKVYLRPTEIAFSGRKEYVTTPFEGKCKKVIPMTAA